MIKFKDGNTRIAFIIFDWMVIKFPNPRIDWIKLMRWDRRNFLKSLKRLPDSLYHALLYGVSANINEALFYKDAGFSKLGIDTILTPVFSIGIINFQIYQGEEIPTRDEVDEFVKTFPPKVFKLYLKCNAHDVGYYNWRKTPKGLKLIDFALPALRSDLAYFLKAVLKYNLRKEMNKRKTSHQP